MPVPGGDKPWTGTLCLELQQHQVQDTDDFSTSQRSHTLASFIFLLPPESCRPQGKCGQHLCLKEQEQLKQSLGFLLYPEGHTVLQLAELMEREISKD